MWVKESEKEEMEGKKMPTVWDAPLIIPRPCAVGGAASV